MIDTTDATSASPDFRKGRRRSEKPALPSPPKIDRLPPHSIEAEQGVLGCLLQAPSESLGICIEKFKRGSEVFYDLRHQHLFDVLVGMYDEKKPIDIITVQQVLKDQNQLEGMGGIAYLSALVDGVPSAANLEYYTSIVREKFILRRMIQTCTGVVGRVYEHEGNVDGLLDEVERDVLQISEDRVEGKSQAIKDLVHKAINTIEDYHQRQGMLTGLGTGFPDLDRMTSGMHGGEMIVIAARPSMGKTSLAMNIAEAVCIDQKQPVGVFSLEMSAESLVLRMLCSRARVNMRNIRDGFLAERDFPKLTGAAGKLAGAPLFIDDTAGLSILQLRAKARRMHQQHGIKLFVIDYLQLLNSSSSRIENRQQEIAQISNGVKALAKELDVPVIVLAQLNREFEKDKSRKPRLSDLRESGAIEQDADLVALLYKANADKGSGEEEENAGSDLQAVPVNLLVAKQRNGPTGDVHLTFLKSYTRFESAAKVAAEDMPAD
ncbi:MAG: replicative DNA helicase [Verrucomicrobiota bacterium]|nr:replicative DNA helicase [Verrucomicrobiota bacterium]